MTEKCIHHWIIDSHSIGTCKKCGEVRHFYQLLLRAERMLSSSRNVYFKPREQLPQVPVKGRRVA